LLASIINKRRSLHQDLSDREQENQTLKSQNVQLQALANLGAATSMIAHEINNLLTPLASYATLAAQNPNDRDLVDKVLDKTRRNCERASKIMESMLALANGQRQEHETVNLRWLVEDVFTCLCRDFQKDSIAVCVEIPEALELHCVLVQIQQVVMNLILNARDAMLPGGGTLAVRAQSNARHIELSVSDTGRGIPANDLEHIFTPFFTTKANGGNSTECSGSGVGLAFCRRVVQAHSGDISVTSQPGKGTTFRIRLPQAQPLDQQ
jgi:signal transduction histidine kinase